MEPELSFHKSCNCYPGGLNDLAKSIVLGRNSDLVISSYACTLPTHHENITQAPLCEDHGQLGIDFYRELKRPGPPLTSYCHSGSSPSFVPHHPKCCLSTEEPGEQPERLQCWAPVHPCLHLSPSQLPCCFVCSVTGDSSSLEYCWPHSPHAILAHFLQASVYPLSFSFIWPFPLHLQLPSLQLKKLPVPCILISSLLLSDFCCPILYWPLSHWYLLHFLSHPTTNMPTHAEIFLKEVKNYSLIKSSISSSSIHLQPLALEPT